MLSSRAKIILALASYGVITIGTWLLNHLNPGPTLCDAVAGGCLISETILVGIWLVFGRTHLLVRSIAALAVIGLHVMLTFFEFRSSGTIDYILFMILLPGLPTLTSAACQMMLRIRKFDIVVAGEGSDIVGRRKVQYSIKTIFAIMILSAIVVVVGKNIPHWSRSLDSYSSILGAVMPILVALAFGSGILSMLAVWTGFSDRLRPHRYLVFAVAATLIGGSFSLIEGSGSTAQNLINDQIIIQTAAFLTLGFILVVRSCGYRLVDVRMDVLSKDA